MVAHARAREDNRDFRYFVEPEDFAEQRAFRGSFSGYERSALFVGRGPGQPYVEAAHGLGLDDDEDGRAVAPLDMDGDGDLDLVVFSLQSLRVFNNPSPARHFARVRLRGTRGEPLALGAVIKIEAGGRATVDRVRLTAGFHTQVEPTVHFGLAEASRVDRVEVRWPDGTVQEHRDLPADRLLIITEGVEEVETQPIPAWPTATRPRGRRPTLQSKVRSLEGEAVPVADAGRPAVVNFWAPWCAACEEEMPALEALSKELGGAVRFVGVSLEREDRAAVAAYAKARGVSYPVRLATDEAIAAFFGPGAEVPLPVTFVFDAGGSVRRAFYRSVTAADVRRALAADTRASPEDLVELASQTREAGNVVEARGHLARALEVAPDDPVTLVKAALGFMELGDTPTARALLEAGAIRHPDVAEIWAVLASLRGAAGDLEAAEAAVARGLDLAPKNPMALNSAGMLHLVRREFPQAIARFEAALAADPNFGLARMNLQKAQAGEVPGQP